MDVLDRRLMVLFQVVITGFVIVLCVNQIHKDNDNLQAWVLLSGTTGYWIQSPRISDR